MQTQGIEGDSEKLVGGGKVMSLFEHLAELRSRIIISLVVVLAFFCVAMFFSSDILLFLKEPLARALPHQAEALHFTGPLDVFLVGIKVSMFTALVFACPVWIYQFWKFIEPALYEKERKFILPFVGISVLLFFLGISFSFFIVIPMCLDFLIALGKEVGTPMITINDYISMLMLMIFGFGFIFEAPLILVLLGVLDLVSAAALAAKRRHIIVVILILSAIITPPDPLSQLGMSIPLYVMFEAALVVIRFIEKKRAL